MGISEYSAATPAKYFERHGVPDNDRHFETPRRYAALLVRYIADPATVRARTMDHFGRSPPVEEIADLRQGVERLRARGRARYDFGEPDESDDGQPFRVRSLCGEREAAAAPAAVLPKSVFQTAEEVMADVCRVLDVPRAALTGPSRCKRVTRARNLAAAVLRARGNSFQSIARRLSRNDHSTVMNCVRQFFARDMRDAQIQSVWQAMAPCILIAARDHDELASMVMGRPAWQRGVPKNRGRG